MLFTVLVYCIGEWRQDLSSVVLAAEGSLASALGVCYLDPSLLIRAPILPMHSSLTYFKILTLTVALSIASRAMLSIQ